MAHWVQNIFGFTTGSGVLARESRTVGDFDEVDLSGSGDVTITQTGEDSLVVEADDNLLPFVTTEVHGRRLVLSMRSGVHFHSTHPVRYTLTVRQLSGVLVSGSGRMRIADLATDSWHVRISGSGDVIVAGQAARQELSISGSGSYTATELVNDATRVDISGSGRATITAREQLDAHISGSGSVRYGGQPRVTKRVSGSGSVRPLAGASSRVDYN